MFDVLQPCKLSTAECLHTILHVGLASPAERMNSTITTLASISDTLGYLVCAHTIIDMDQPRTICPFKFRAIIDYTICIMIIFGDCPTGC